MLGLREQFSFRAIVEERMVEVEGTLRIPDINFFGFEELELIQPYLNRMTESTLRVVTNETEISYLLKVERQGTSGKNTIGWSGNGSGCVRRAWQKMLGHERVRHKKSTEKLEEWDNKIIVGNRPPQEKFDAVCASLSTLERREEFAYEVEAYEMVDSAWELSRLYVMTARFLGTEVRDIGIYLPTERSKDLVYGRCWQRAREVVEDEKDRLLSLKKEVAWSTEIRIFEDLPRPRIPYGALTGIGRGLIIDFINGHHNPNGQRERE